MYKKVYLTAFIFLFALLTGCGKNPVAEDVISYINNDLPTLEQKREKISKEYESVTGDNFKTDDQVYEKLTKIIIPEYQTLINDAEKVKPKTPELKAVHELYISAINKRHSAMLRFQSAFEKHDRAGVADGNESLEEGKRYTRDFHTQLTELAKKNGVEFKKTNK